MTGHSVEQRLEVLMRRLLEHHSRRSALTAAAKRHGVAPKRAQGWIDRSVEAGALCVLQAGRDPSYTLAKPGVIVLAGAEVHLPPWLRQTLPAKPAASRRVYRLTSLSPVPQLQEKKDKPCKKTSTPPATAKTPTQRRA